MNHPSKFIVHCFLWLWHFIISFSNSPNQVIKEIIFICEIYCNKGNNKCYQILPDLQYDSRTRIYLHYDNNSRVLQHLDFSIIYKSYTLHFCLICACRFSLKIIMIIFSRCKNWHIKSLLVTKVLLQLLSIGINVPSVRWF